MSEEKRKFPISKRQFLRIAAGAGICSAGSMVYGFGIEPNLVRINRQDLPIKDLPTAFSGKKIVQLTDIHFNKDQDARLLEEVVSKVNDLEPDFVIYTGDYIVNDMHHFPEMMSFLGKISSNFGIAAIPGNHDVWHGNNWQIRKAFEKRGVNYLVNQYTQVNLKGERIFINGLDSIWGGHPDVRKSFSGIKQAEVGLTLMHEPDVFDKITEHRETLVQFSGHTHGGQCRFPLIGYAPVKVKFGQKYIKGSYTKSQSQQLFVSSGIGTVGLRVRFACAPEIVIFTMKSV